MTIGNIGKKFKKKARTLKDSLHGHGRPSLSPNVSATETAHWQGTPGSSGSVASDMVEGVALVSPVNQSSHQALVPIPTIRVSPEQQLSNAVASANAVSLTENNRPLTAVCALYYAILTILMYPAELDSHENRYFPRTAAIIVEKGVR
jgi:hypothetical protein